MADVWDDHAGAWDDAPGTKEYADAAFGSLGAILDRFGIPLGGASVVDFGCGTGLLTEHLVDVGADVVAVDTSEAMLAVLADKVDRLGWHRVSITDRLADLDGTYDVIVCSSVCSFLDDYPGTAEQLVALLRPGGVFVQWDWEREADASGGGLSRDEVAETLAGAGLVAVEVATAFDVEVEGEVMRPLVGHGRRPGVG